MAIYSSVVDFLSGRGFTPAQGEQFPLYQKRKQIYESLGLNQTLGDYRGSAEQNPALLTALQQAERNAGVSITPNNLDNVISAARGGSTQPSSGTAQPQPENQDAGGIPDYLRSLAEKARSSDINESTLAEEAIKKYTGSTEYALAEEAAQADKAAAQLKSERDTQELITKLASRGLYFSGARTAGVESIDIDRLSSLLNIDRKFAKIVAEGLSSSAKEIAKQAKDGQSDAISALDKLGFVVAPDGSIVQKPSEARAEASAARAEESASIAGQVITIKDGRRVLYDKKTQSVIADLGASGATGEGTKLSAARAIKLGLPLSLANQSELSVFTQLQNPAPPEWFVAKTVKDWHPPMVIPQSAQAQWDAYRTNTLERVKGLSDATQFGEKISAAIEQYHYGLGLEKEALEDAFKEQYGDPLPKNIQSLIDESYAEEE